MRSQFLLFGNAVKAADSKLLEASLLRLGAYFVFCTQSHSLLGKLSTFKIV